VRCCPFFELVAFELTKNFINPGSVADLLQLRLDRAIVVRLSQETDLAGHTQNAFTRQTYRRVRIRPEGAALVAYAYTSR
jgi:hypothetical protein